MDRLDVMQLFVRVADLGSFSKAARAAGIVQSTVSKQIAALEESLGAELLRRTSRGLSLTEAGRDFYESAVKLLADLKTAESRIGKGKVSPSGTVKVALTAGFGSMYVVPCLPEFFAKYPEISLDFDVSERHVNLIESGIDVAIRMGQLRDSALIARRIGGFDTMTVATPAYFEKFGKPTSPTALQKHAHVAFIFQGAPRVWEFKSPSGVIAFTPRGALRSNDAPHLRAAVLAGVGIAHNAGWLFAADIASGAVTRVLQSFAPDPLPIHAVCPSGRMIPRKVSVFIDFLAEICASEKSLRIRGS